MQTVRVSRRAALGLDTGQTLQESENPGVDVPHAGNVAGRCMRGKAPWTGLARVKGRGRARSTDTPLLRMLTTRCRVTRLQEGSSAWR